MDDTIENANKRVQYLIAEAESKKLTVGEFAGKIWLGTIEDNLAELALASMMIQKALSISSGDACQMIKDLKKLTLRGDSEAIKLALLMICDGLLASNPNPNSNSSPN